MKGLKQISLFVLLLVTFSGCVQKEDQHSVYVRIAKKSPDERPSIVEEGDVATKREDAEKTAIQQGRIRTFRQSFGKVWHIGLLVPVSGKYKAIGDQVVDMAIFAVNFQKAKNVRILVIDTKETREDALRAAQIAAKLKVDVVVGPVFSSQTSEVETVLAKEKIKIISLSNDITLASQNVYPFGLYPDALLMTVLHYNKEQGNENYGLILESSQDGYKLGKKIGDLLKDIGGTVITTEYYKKQQNVFASVVQTMYQQRFLSFKQDENGNLSLISVRDARKLTPEEKDAREKMPTVRKEMDSVYTDAKGEDLYRLIQEILNSNFKNKDLTFIINDSFVATNDFVFNNYHLSNVIFPGVATSRLKKVEIDTEAQFGYKPTRVALIANDAIAFLIYLMKKGSFNDKSFYSPDGYKGLYGDFRFTPHGVVQRRFAVYRANNKKSEMVYHSPIFV